MIPSRISNASAMIRGASNNLARNSRRGSTLTIPEDGDGEATSKPALTPPESPLLCAAANDEARENLAAIRRKNSWSGGERYSTTNP